MLAVGGEPPLKKIRKGTFSCWECKRRKVRCVFRPEEESKCTGCRSRGMECHSQKSIDEGVAATANRSIPDRVGRLEVLMETCIQSLKEVPQNGASNSYDALTPSSLTTPNIHETGPVLSLFNNDILDPGYTSENLSSSDTARLRVYARARTSLSKRDRTCQTLLALIPSRSHVEAIVESAGDWWRIWHYVYPDICDIGESSSLADFTSRAHSEQHLVTIANVLLCIAFSVQKLPPTFDFSSILMSCSAKDLVEEYTTIITTLVASDDELTASIEGLECLVLLAKIYMDSGKPRKAWLSFRRAMNVAEIIGLHKNSVRSAVGPDGITASRKSTVGISRGISDEFCDLDAGDEETETTYIKKIAKIAVLLCDRNQAISGPSYSVTQELEEKLRLLSSQMPPSWWSFPAISTGSDGAVIMYRVMQQLWHYQIELLLHLPFMLRASNEPKYEYNKYMCLNASREVIERCLLSKKSEFSIFRSCKMVEFQAFIAAVVLQLNLLSHTNTSSSENPRRMPNDLETVDGVMKELVRHPSNENTIATQAVKVLETLKSFTRANGTVGSRIKLKIPYFGTISIRREGKSSNVSSGLPNYPELTSTDVPEQIATSNNQSFQLIPPMDDGSISRVGSLEPPQVSFTSSIFANPNETLARWSEDDWSIPGLDMQFENNRIPDLDGTWDWFADESYPAM